jgi:diphthine-ammonia ligase
MSVRAAVSWSGGKDCCLALMRVSADVEVRTLVTMFDEHNQRSRSHGLRRDVIEAHADRLRVPLLTAGATWADYETVFIDLLRLAASTGCTHVIFGDIFEDTHRAWNERVAAAAGLTPIQPLWGEPTTALVREFLDRGGEARLTTVRSTFLDDTWLGTALTRDAVNTFELAGIDPCGERGEYHTVVTNCPLFHAPIVLAAGERVSRGGCGAVDLRLASPDERGPYTTHAHG